MAKKGKRRSSFDAKKKEPPKTNPFEKLGSKKRFDILGRKVRGDVRNVGQLRTDAADKVSVRRAICRGIHLTPQHRAACRHARDRPPRVPPQRKKTLLVEYKQLRKSNAFIDRRFGGALGGLGWAPLTVRRLPVLGGPAACYEAPTRRC